MRKLSIYLNAHLTAAKAALGLAQRAARREEDTPLGHFLRQLSEDIAADRGALEQIMELLQIRVGRLRLGLGWIGEKIARVAVGGMRPAESEFTRLQELELLALAIEGKRALWQSLRQLSATHPNLRGVNLDDLVRRAEEQRLQLESWRLSAAVTAFPPRIAPQPAPVTSA